MRPYLRGDAAMTTFQHMLFNHYTTLLLVFLCSLKLYSLKQARDAELRFIWVTVVSCLLLALEDMLETVAATDPDLLFWRILLSVIGYILRPVAAVGLLAAVSSPAKRTWKLWIPALINTSVNLTAFFSPVAFSYDEGYDFVRGPLGYVVFAVSFLYLFQILYVILHRFYEGKRSERWLLVCSVLGVLAAAIVDAWLAGRHLNEAILIGCICILFFLRTPDNYLDPLTSLRNRFAYYDDSENLTRNITAVASIDMNGLKRLNDSRGHAAGDAALAAIGKCLYDVSDRRTSAYRVGGDEFVVLFIDQTQADVEQILRRIRESISETGYSISVGYTMKAPEQTLDDALRVSDQNMYGDKAAYYRTQGIDRRRNRT